MKKLVSRIMIFVFSTLLVMSFGGIHHASVAQETVKRCSVTEQGRYRVSGAITAGSANNIVIVYHNNKIIWRQFVPAEEDGIIDIRVLSEIGDVLEVKVDGEYGDCGFTIEKFDGTIPVCVNSTSSGEAATVSDSYSLSSFISTDAEDTANYYWNLGSQYFKLLHNNGAWKCSEKDSVAYLTKDYVKPGLGDIVVEVKAPRDGIIRLSGEIPQTDDECNALSEADKKIYHDGALVEISHNNNFLWSNRVGGNRSVKWDEPYDVCYFDNTVNATASVKEGDVLKFSFNRWRLADHDKIDIRNIYINYISEKPMKESTLWKLEESKIIDIDGEAVYHNGASSPADIVVIDENTYISKTDATTFFGLTSTNETEHINNKEYIELKNALNDSKLNYANTDGNYMIAYNDLPMFFGYSEISEINTAIKEKKFPYGDDINQVVDSIVVAGTRLSRFDETQANYEVGINEDRFDALTTDDILINFADGVEVASPYKRITFQNEKTITAEINIVYGEHNYSYTLTINRVLTPLEKYNQRIAENFNDISSLTAHKFIRSEGGTTEFTNEAGRGKVIKRYRDLQNLRVYFDATSLDKDERRIGKLTYEFDIKIPVNTVGSTDGSGRPTTLYLRKNENEKAALMHFRHSIVVDKDNAKLKSVTPGDWCTIRVEFDFSAAEPVYNTYVNGEIQVSEGTYDPKYDPFSMVCFHAWGVQDNAYEYRLDNIRISYTEDEPVLRIEDVALVSNNDGTYSIKGCVVNRVTKDLSFIVAAYKAGMLVAADCSTMRLKNTGRNQFNTTLSSAKNKDFDYIRLFVFDYNNIPKPLGYVYEP